MKDDINSGFENLVEVDSKTVASRSPGNSAEQNHACVKSRLNIHLSFWQGIKANQWVTSLSTMVTLSHLLNYHPHIIRRTLNQL